MMALLSRVKVLRVLAVPTILILTLSILMVTRTPARAASQTECSHTFVSSPSPGTNSNSLGAVSAVSSNDVWAVGNFSSSGATQTLTEHWDGASWSVKSSPSPGSSFNGLFAVSAVASNDVWAVGEFRSPGASKTLIEHWDGREWHVVPSPSPGSSLNALFGVLAVSSSDVWAVGEFISAGATQTLIEHWNGGEWHVVSSPSPASSANFLFGVSAVASNDVWAVGQLENTGDSGSQTLIEHWNGGEWHVVPGVNFGSRSNGLSDVTAIASNDVWAVGAFQNTGTNELNRPLTEHWNGSSWSVVPDTAATQPGFGGVLSGVAATNSRTVWTVGYSITQDNTIGQTLTERWTPDNGWRVLTNPSIGTSFSYLNRVSALKTTSGPAVVWAVGAFANTSGPSQTLTEFIVC